MNFKLVSFLHILIVTLALSATVFEILMLIDGKWLNFPPHPCLRHPLGGNRLECRDEIWQRKTRIVGLPDSEEILTLAFFVLTQYRLVTDGRTDRHVAFAKTRASIAPR